MRRWKRRVAAAGTAAALVLGQLIATSAPAQAADPVTLNLLTINDFHGRIEANTADGNPTVKFAGTVEKLRADGGAANTLLIGAGDFIGASLFNSSVQDDQPTIDVMNELGLDVSAVGNHEFDKGWDDLRVRVIAGGTNAQWDYLGANVYQKGTTTPVLPEYGIYRVGGLDVGVIGVVTQETPSLVSPDGVSTLDFGDPVAAINRVADQLTDGNDANGEADVLVATLHEGAPESDPPASLDSQVAASPVFAAIVNDTSPKVAAIVNGHTHQAYAYRAPVPGKPGRTRPILQTGNYGNNVGQIKLTVDPATNAVTDYTVGNVPRVSTSDTDLIATYPAVKAVNDTVQAALAYAGQVGNQPIGSLTEDITTATTPAPTTSGVCDQKSVARDDRAAESTLGNLVANALLESLSPENRGGAEITFVNPGGLRAELCYAAIVGNDSDAPGRILYSEANAVLPFVNNLWTTDLTGAQIKTALEQQWQRDANGNIPSRPYLQLGTSDNLTYTFDPNAAEGSHITSITFKGEPLNPTRTYRVGSFSFLLQGGDNFRVFAQGTNLKDSGLIDRDAWIKYLQDNSPASPSFARHAVAVTGRPTSPVAAGSTISFDMSRLDLTSLGSPTNTTLSGTLTPASGKPVDVGPITVSGGAAHVEFAVPTVIDAGAAALELIATPSGTTVTIPLTITATSSVALTADRTSQVYGAGNPVTLTATVTASQSAGGSVDFRDGSTVLATVPVSNGTATYRLSPTTPAGEHTIVAHYSGADPVPAADSAPVTVTVSKAGSVTVLAPALALPLFGTMLIGAVGLNNGQTAHGTVEIRDNGTAVGSTAVQSHGLFVLLTSRPAKGQHSYTAVFTPSDPANVAGSTSNPVVVRR